MDRYTDKKTLLCQLTAECNCYILLCILRTYVPVVITELHAAHQFSSPEISVTMEGQVYVQSRIWKIIEKLVEELKNKESDQFIQLMLWLIVRYLSMQMMF